MAIKEDLTELCKSEVGEVHESWTVIQNLMMKNKKAIMVNCQRDRQAGKKSQQPRRRQSLLTMNISQDGQSNLKELPRIGRILLLKR